MPKGPSPMPWKPAKLNSKECVCPVEEEVGCPQEEDDDDDECCCAAEPKKPKRKSGNSNDCSQPKEEPCCCDQGDDDDCDSDDDDQNGGGAMEGCCVVDDICSVESQKMPQNKVFPLEDDNGKGCPCMSPPSPPKGSGKGCN